MLLAEEIRRRLVRRLERRFLGDRGDPLAVLARLREVDSAADLDDQRTYDTITRTIGEAVRSPSVALALQFGSDLAIVSERSPKASAEAMVMPLIHRGERLGELRIGARTPGEPFGHADRALLEQLAHETSVLIYSRRREGEVQRMRWQALDAIAEERARLGRDLHDGIAPLLAGAGLTAEALRRSMAPGGADDNDTERLAARLRTAASEVRRLAHDLQPAALRSGGLVAALADFIGSLPESTRFSLDTVVDRALPPTVEQSAYLVVMESVNNVIQHAQADSATVRVTAEHGVLTLTVTDDGNGIDQPYVSGVGIQSMRGRVQALGGTFELGPGPEGGTTLRAAIPLGP